MKTRIKIVKHGDGKTVYYAQAKPNFAYRISELFQSHPFGFILFLPISFIGSFIVSKILWENLRLVNDSMAEIGDFGGSILCTCYDIESAKRIIDTFLLNNQAELEMKLAQKKAKKVVSKTYLKYP